MSISTRPICSWPLVIELADSGLELVNSSDDSSDDSNADLVEVGVWLWTLRPITLRPITTKSACGYGSLE